MLYAFQLGRLPQLGIAELRSIFPDAELEYSSVEIALFDIPEIDDPQKLQDRLGSVIRIMKVEALDQEWVVPTWESILQEKRDQMESKLVFGATQFGSGDLIDAKQFGMLNKKELKKSGHAVRYVGHDHHILPTASVLHNKLTTDGVELVSIKGKSTHYVGTTRAIQNIDAYTLRDADKPVRDMKRGMLPPKLAQTMLNFAHIPDGGSVLDPFLWHWNYSDGSNTQWIYRIRK